MLLKTTAGLTASSCYLVTKGSTCALTLTINGSAIPSTGIQVGPVLCEEGNPNQCYQPAAGNQLKVTLSTTPPITQATISSTPASLTLTTVTPENTGTITVSSTSSIAALNITADVSATGGALSAPGYSSTCAQLVTGGAPCIITFTANSPLSSTAIPIKGDNTNGLTAVIAVDQAALSINPASLTLEQNGTEQFVTITNNGPVDAFDVAATIATPTQGVSQSSNTCPTSATPLASGSQCQIGFTQSGNFTGNTSATIAGSNTTTPAISLPITLSTAPTTTISVPSPAIAAIPLDDVGGVDITITNNTANPATNVHADLSGTRWATTDVTSTSCDAPGNGTCTFTITSKTNTPYIAQGNIPIVGDNVTSSQTMAFAFTAQGFLIWDVSGTTVHVIDNSDSSSLEQWSNAVTTNAQNLTDGFVNTNIINSAVGIGTSAAVSCFNSTSGGALTGTWYLPAICQMGGTNQGAGCSSGLANIDTNLIQLGFSRLRGGYWSSTEFSLSPQGIAWYQEFPIGGGGGQGGGNKFSRLGVRCSRALTL